MPAEDSINLDHFLTENVYPALYDNLETAFPEFDWIRKNGHWTANTWPAGFPYAVNDQHAARLMVYEDRPWWIKVHGHSGVRFLDYVNHGRKPEGVEFPAAVRHLCERAGVLFPERTYSEEAWQKVRQRETRRTALDGLIAYAQHALWSPCGERARVFLQERGFTDADVRELGFGFYAAVAEAERYLREHGCDLQAAKEVSLFWEGLQGYILIPWFDAQGYPLTLYGRWAAKTPPAGKPKTIALPGEGTKASPLYFDRARKAGHKEVVLVEGVFDAALLQVRGDVRVVASVAAQLSGLQLETLGRYRVRSVFICGDPDGGGDQGTIANVDVLTKAGIASYVPPRLPDGLDPDEFVLRFGIEGWRANIAQSISGPRFRVHQLLGTVCPSSPDHERHEAVARVLDYLAILHGEWALLEKEGLIRLTAEQTGYPIALLEEMAKNRTTRQQQQSPDDAPWPEDADAPQEEQSRTQSTSQESSEKTKTSGQSFAFTSLKDLFAEEEEQTEWLVEDLLPQGGFSLLVAKPKVGKSTLARNLAFAATRNTTFLNRPTHQGPVLYLALEEKRSEVRKHFKDMGATGDEVIFIHAASAPVDALQKIRPIVAEKKPVLIIIDPLFRLARVKDGNDYAQVTAALEPLLVLARETQAHVLCVHHAGKGDREGGDSILGSTAIFAAVDTALIMKRSERYRTLSSIQRYGEDLSETVLRFDPQTRTVSLGQAKEQEEADRIGEAILAALKAQEDDKEKGHPLTQAEIDEAVEGKTTYKRKALKTLFEAKQVERIGKGGKTDPFRYCLKDSRFLVPPYSKEHGNKNQKNDPSAEEDKRYSCSPGSEENETPHKTWEQEKPLWEDTYE